MKRAPRASMPAAHSLDDTKIPAWEGDRRSKSGARPFVDLDRQRAGPVSNFPRRRKVRADGNKLLRGPGPFFEGSVVERVNAGWKAVEIILDRFAPFGGQADVHPAAVE